MAVKQWRLGHHQRVMRSDWPMIDTELKFSGNSQASTGPPSGTAPIVDCADEGQQSDSTLKETSMSNPTFENDETPSAWSDGGDNNSESPSKKPSIKQMSIAGVVALALVGGGVFGVHEFGSSSSKAAAGPGAQGAPGQGRTGIGGGTRGTLQSVSGSTLIVKSARDSSAINVSTDGSTKFLKASTGSLSDVKVGDYVSVGGAADSSGNVTATSITDSGTTNISVGGFGGPGGGAPPAGGQVPTQQNGNPPQPPSDVNGQDLQAQGQGQGRRFGNGGAGRPGGTTGQVTAVNGSTITVKTFANSVTVTTSPSTTVQKLQSSDINSLTVGDSLTVEGSSSAGAVTARQVIVGLTTMTQAPPQN